MKMCSRCLFMSPAKALMCMTCGSIQWKLNEKESRDDFYTESEPGVELFEANSTDSISNRAVDMAHRAMGGLTAVGGAASGQFESMKAEIKLLGPKIASAYHKVVALATVSSANGLQRNNRRRLVDFAELESENYGVRSFRAETSSAAALFDAPELVVSARKASDSSLRNLYDFTPSVNRSDSSNSSTQAAQAIAPETSIVHNEEHRSLPIILRNILNDSAEDEFLAADPISNSAIPNETFLEVAPDDAQPFTTNGYAFFAVPDQELEEPVFESMSSERLEELKHELELARDWFHNFGRNGVLTDESSREEQSDDDENSSGTRHAA